MEDFKDKGFSYNCRLILEDHTGLEVRSCHLVISSVKSEAVLFGL